MRIRAEDVVLENQIEYIKRSTMNRNLLEESHPTNSDRKVCPLWIKLILPQISQNAKGNSTSGQRSEVPFKHFTNMGSAIGQSLAPSITVLLQ